MSEAISQTITAAEYINSQLELEHEAREVLPYSFDTCTYLQGPLRQPIYSCKTHAQPSGAGSAVCYSCSISCHSECELVELFTKRNVQCDCGTSSTPGFTCTLRKTQDDIPADTNVYCHNYDGRFCECDQLYDIGKENGTMYQCLLGDVCNEDWYHDTCIVGIRKTEQDTNEEKPEEAAQSKKVESVVGELQERAEEAAEKVEGTEAHKQEDKKEEKPEKVESIIHDIQGKAEHAVEKIEHEEASKEKVQPQDISTEEDAEEEEELDPRLAALPSDDDFESFICWKCIEKNSWLKHYSGKPGFLPGVPHDQGSPAATALLQAKGEGQVESQGVTSAEVTDEPRGIKRKSPDTEEAPTEEATKRTKKEEDTDTTTSTSHKTTTALILELDPSFSVPGEVVSKTTTATDTTTTTSTTITTTTTTSPNTCLLPSNPPPLQAISLFLKDDFRQHLCHCPSCMPLLQAHPILLNDIPSYSPPLSRASTPSIHSSTGSLLERGEKALNTMDRVKAIEGVMAYNSLRDKVKEFLKPFAESGKEVGAEDVKKYFEALRGDSAASGGAEDSAPADGNGRQEQSDY